MWKAHQKVTRKALWHDAFYFIISLIWKRTQKQNVNKQITEAFQRQSKKGSQTFWVIKLYNVKLMGNWFPFFLLCCYCCQYLSTCMLTTNLFLYKVRNMKTRKRREICRKLTIKTSELRHWHRWIITDISQGAEFKP